MKIKNIWWKRARNSIAFTALIVGAIIAISVLFQVQDVVYEQFGYQRQNHLIVLADGDPGAGVGGFFYYMIYPHQASPAVAYASNLSNASAYEFSDSVNASLTGETPYSTAFDIVVKWGYNATQDWNATASAWNNTWVWMTITNADLSIGADTNMTEIEIANTSATYRWMHYYMNNGGAGYQISHGQSFNTTSLKPWAYY